MKHFAFALATHRRTSHCGALDRLLGRRARCRVVRTCCGPYRWGQGTPASELRRARVRCPEQGSTRRGQRARREGQLEPVRSCGLGDQVRRLPRDRARGARRRVGRTHLARRQQGALQAELDGRARRGDGAAARRHDQRLRDRLPTAGERRRVDRRRRDGRVVGSQRCGLERRLRVIEPDRRRPTRPAPTPRAGGCVDRGREPRRRQRLDRRRLRSGEHEAGTTTLAVDGFSEPQHVKKAVFATPHRGARAAYRQRRHDERDGNLARLRRRRRRADRRAALPPEPVDNISDNPTWLAPRIAPPFNAAERVSVELPDHGHARALLLDRDRGLRRRRGGHRRRVYPLGRRLEVPVGRPARPGDRRRSRHERRRPATTSTTPRVWSGSHGAYGNPALVRATSATRDYQYRVHERLVHVGLQPEQRQRRDRPTRQRHRGSTVTNLFVGHNRHARLRVLPRLRRGRTGTRSSTTTASRRSTRRHRRAAHGHAARQRRR